MKHTLEQLSAMSDRELDAVVASVVFGWSLSKRLGYGWPIHGSTVPPVKIPNYVSWSGMERVVEKMHRDKLDVALFSRGREWTAHFLGPWDDGSTPPGKLAWDKWAYDRKHPTRAVAIAAVLAVEASRE